jgi:hypothetical protein
VYYRTGEYDKALPYAQQSLAVKQKIFGYDYFDNVVNLHNLSALAYPYGFIQRSDTITTGITGYFKKIFW